MDYHDTSIKKLSKIDKENNVANSSKYIWKQYYINYFIDLIVSFYEWNNIPDNWKFDKLFVEKQLCSYGCVALIDTEQYGIISIGGTMSGVTDIFLKPSHFIPTTVRNNTFGLNKRYEIAWTKDDYEKGKALIILNDPYYRSSMKWLIPFCDKLAEIERTIEINRMAQRMPFLLFVNEQTKLSGKNIMQKVINGDLIITMSKPKDKNSVNDDYFDISKMFQQFNTQTPYLIDKLTDDKNHVLGQILTRIGINNNPIDKAERVNSSEANSNNGLIMASTEINWHTRRDCCKLINKCLGTSIEVYPSQSFSNVNINNKFDYVNNEVSEWRIQE